MATWHQARAGHIRPTTGKVSVVTDPPNDCRGVRVFDDVAEAEAYMTRLVGFHPNLKGYVYILQG